MLDEMPVPTLLKLFQNGVSEFCIHTVTMLKEFSSPS